MKRGGWGRVREAPAYHELQSAVASKTPPQPPACFKIWKSFPGRPLTSVPEVTDKLAGADAADCFGSPLGVGCDELALVLSSDPNQENHRCSVVLARLFHTSCCVVFV